MLEIEFIWSLYDGWKCFLDVCGMGGKVVVFDFWVMWCGFCVELFLYMWEFVEYYCGYDVEIVGVISF